MIKKIIFIILILAGIGGIIASFENFEIILLVLSLIYSATGIIIFKKSKVKKIKHPQLAEKNDNFNDHTSNITNVSSTSENSTYTRKQNHFYFNVVGISKKNDKGKDIQKLIRNYVKQYTEIEGFAYDGLTNKEILETGYDRVYESNIFGYNEIYFEPEPDNPYDSNSIKVIHKEIGHVGYVPSNLTAKVFEAISSGYEIEWRLVGGKYKYIGYDDYGKNKIKTETHNYGIVIDLYY